MNVIFRYFLLEIIYLNDSPLPTKDMF